MPYPVEELGCIPPPKGPDGRRISASVCCRFLASHAGGLAVLLAHFILWLVFDGYLPEFQTIW